MLSYFVASGLSLFLYFLNTAFYCFEVLQLKLCINDFFVAYRIYTTVDMGNIFIIKTTQYMKNCVCFTDICQEFIS